MPEKPVGTASGFPVVATADAGLPDTLAPVLNYNAIIQHVLGAVAIVNPQETAVENFTEFGRVA